jgi:hypothetical protein
MMSYIEHNGGTVLAVATDKSGVPYPSSAQPGSSIAQTGRRTTGAKLSSRFTDAARNAARLPQLAEHMAACAKKQSFDLTAEQCLILFEQGLNKNGNSVFALTDGECRKLISDMNDRSMGGFIALFKKLGIELPPASLQHHKHNSINRPPKAP